MTLWGSGTPRREFLHVDDVADACVFLMRNYSAAGPINVGVGKDLAVRELAEMVSSIVGYRGSVRWDRSKPDGTPRKLLDVGKLHALGWRASMLLRDGIRATYDWHLAHVAPGLVAIRGIPSLQQVPHRVARLAFAQSMCCAASTPRAMLIIVLWTRRHN